jgi:hypothetical protein
MKPQEIPLIRIAMTYEREILLFEISNKIIIYKDRKWQRGFQFMPEDPNITKTILLSRNSIKHEMLKWIKDSNSGKNLEEYNAANTDDELKEIIVRDAKLKGCVLRKIQWLSLKLNDEDKYDEVLLKEQ